VKRRRITEDQAVEFLALLATLNVKIRRPISGDRFSSAARSGQALELTAYDVAYLDLATRMALPLATRDAV